MLFQKSNLPPVTYASFDGFECPSQMSGTAVKILQKKYARQRGVPSAVVRVDEPGVPVWLQRRIPAPDATFGGEISARNIYERIAGAWTYWGYTHGYFADEASARNFFESIIAMLEHQVFAPNSPQWFNTGLFWAYGIMGKASGGYYVDETSGQLVEGKNAYERPFLHACFIQSVQDDLVNPDGIMDLWTREARVFKYGGGSGVNYSNIRAEGEPLSGGGASSGLMSFLEIGDRAGGAIKSGGTTRRAAKMVVIDVDHPDIEKYIDWKVISEDKVAALVAGSRLISRFINAVRRAVADYDGDGNRYSPRDNAALRKVLRKAKTEGVPIERLKRTIQAMKNNVHDQVAEYDTWWEGEAYRTVSGQNANNSVRVDDRFMNAVKDGLAYPLYHRTEIQAAKEESRTAQPCRMINAKVLWDKIAYAAWACADPGIQFKDTINAWHTCPIDGEIRASNPCGEFLFLDNTACNLASIRLTAFCDEDGHFDVDAFREAVRIITLALEISVAMAQYPSAEVARNSYTHRPLGLGFADLGGLLMRLGVPYDSDAGRGIATGIAALMHCTAYATSAEIASVVGPFPAYARNRNAMMRVIRNHYRAVFQQRDFEGLNVLPYNAMSHCPDYLRDAAEQAAQAMLDLGEKHGYRNAQVTAIAPTGTIGLYMDCDTTGIEPDYALIKFKSLAGGGHLWLINNAVAPALRSLGYSASEINEIKLYLLGHGDLGKWRVRLLQAGLSPEEVDRGERDLAGRIPIQQAFAMRGYTDGALLLRSLGFDGDEIDELEAYVCGHGTLERCPIVYPDHLPVFDCANRTGRRSTRFIRPLGHLLMLAAVQPFISGGISKTVNLPDDAGVSAISEIYMRAWELGIKAVALYRDGSKLSQPLTSDFGIDNNSEEEQDGNDDVVESTHPRLARGEQDKLPAVRRGLTFKASVGGQTVFLRSGEYEDGRLGEIFIDASRCGSTLSSILDCFAIAVSIGLQYGVPLEEFVEQFTFTKFDPSGIVQGHPQIKNATSIIDYAFRALGIHYLGRSDLAHVAGHKQDDTELLPQMLVSLNGKHAATTVNDKEGKQSYTGDVCPSCGSGRMIRSGTCKVCLECGSTTGCS